MLMKYKHNGTTWTFDIKYPLDISIPLQPGKQNPSAWGVTPPEFSPVRQGDFVGDVGEGGSVNFRDVKFNPHGNGTHTECVGHISKEKYTVNQCLEQFHFVAELISVKPEEHEGDQVIMPDQVKKAFENNQPQALVIRTLPNDPEKKTRAYTGSNPPYLHPETVGYIRDQGVDHLLVDLPSVDKEDDGGELNAHKAFWDYPYHTKTHRTITELVYVPDKIIDSTYMLNLHIASFESDASPSKPVLYPLVK